MKKFFPFILLIVSVVGCDNIEDFFLPDKFFYFTFINESDNDVITVLDYVPQDGQISIGSTFRYTNSNSKDEIYNSGPWDSSARGCVHLYVIDADLVKLDLQYGHKLTEEEISQISLESVLARITLTMSDLKASKVVHYPSLVID